MSMNGFLGLIAGGAFIIGLLIFGAQRHEITILTNQVNANASQILLLKAESAQAVAKADDAQKKAISQEATLYSHIQNIEKQPVSSDCQKAMDWMLNEAVRSKK